MIAGADIKLGRQEGAENQNWVGVNIYGDDPSKLQDIAREARTSACAPGILRNSYGFRQRPRRGTDPVESRSGQEVQHLFSVVGQPARYCGARPGDSGYRTAEGEVDIWMRLQASDRSDLQDLRSIVVGVGPDGNEATLDQVAKFES